MGVDYKRDVPLLAFNFASAILIISVNKIVFNSGFNFPILLTVIQYLITWTMLEVLAIGGFFKRLNIPADKHLWVLAFAIGTATAISNLSLKYNSVGVYTISKLLLTPAAVCGEYILRGKVCSKTRMALLAFLCLCVLFSSKTDLDINIKGSICVISWLPVAVIYKVGWASAVKDRGFDTLALMHYIMPYASIFCSTMSFFLEDTDAVVNGDWATYYTFLLLIISGLSAFLINLSGFLVMGLLSPLTHIVLGQAKSAVMMLIGILCFGYNPQAKSVLGAVLAMASITCYTYVNIKEQQNSNQKTNDSREKGSKDIEMVQQRVESQKEN
ncbi:hypothetical protein AAMO2058_001590400 [Amorphochlora amoebiformis]|uniref:Sugar phosphate transporter domain-containing protein n=1 Tax=Amorphochlora amoebiformis TaxID=1561963 RepID=A0A7S0DHJ0_9EUKA|mmetsp:Transcript_28476/g.45358  ORF Transcript_28476/g.45358 Transcript_28476/m.45358 type:complete len:328 (+) Transcript_28476:68-1051(+)